MELQLWHQDRDSYVMRKGYKNREINILVAHVDSQPARHAGEVHCQTRRNTEDAKWKWIVAADICVSSNWCAVACRDLGRCGENYLTWMCEQPTSWFGCVSRANILIWIPPPHCYLSIIIFIGSNPITEIQQNAEWMLGGWGWGWVQNQPVLSVSLCCCLEK